MGKQPLLSIAVSTYTMERLDDIVGLLESIKAQTYPLIEVVVIVERSQELFDRLKQCVAEKSIPRAKVVFNNGTRGLSAARNLAVKEATGDIISFIDDDAFPFPDWAQQIVKTYEEDDTVIGVTGPSIPLWEHESVAWVPEEFYWIIGGSGYSDWTEKREVRNVSGTNMSFRREAFERAGLFSPYLGAKGGGASGKHELVGDETELSIRVRQKTGKRIVFNPRAVVRHKVYKYRITPGFVARRAYWEGYTKAMFRRVYHTENKAQKLLSPEYDLLRRIFTRLFPRILCRLFVHPVTAWRQLALTVNALFFVAIGYFSFTIRHIASQEKTVIHLQES